MFVVPTAMNIANIKRRFKTNNAALTNQAKVEVGLNYGLMGTGVVMGGLGVIISVLRQMGKL